VGLPVSYDGWFEHNRHYLSENDFLLKPVVRVGEDGEAFIPDFSYEDDRFSFSSQVVLIETAASLAEASLRLLGQFSLVGQRNYLIWRVAEDILSLYGLLDDAGFRFWLGLIKRKHLSCRFLNEILRVKHQQLDDGGWDSEFIRYSLPFLLNPFAGMG
jgi:hypothetical protein